MRGALTEEIIAPFIARGFNEANVKILQRIRKVWNRVEIKDKEFRGSSNGVIGDYHKWLKSRKQGITWLPKLKGLNGKEAEIPEESEEVQALKAKLERTRVVKEKLKVAVTKVRKECDELKNINMTTVEVLEWERKKGPKGRMEKEQVSGGFVGQQ